MTHYQKPSYKPVQKHFPYHETCFEPGLHHASSLHTFSGRLWNHWQVEDSGIQVGREPFITCQALFKELFIHYWLYRHSRPKQKSLSRVRLFAAPWTAVHGTLQARVLEWVALLFGRGSSQPRDRTQVSPIAGGFFTSWATREAEQA